jgi:hypothetical protein
MPFTAILGNASALLGQIQLGAGLPAADPTLSVSSFVSADTTIGVEILPSPLRQSLSSLAIVASTVGVAIERVVSLSHTVGVTATGAVSEAARVSHFSVDVVYQRERGYTVSHEITVGSEAYRVTPPRVTHYSVDVVYRKAPEVAVVHNVQVNHDPRRVGVDYEQIVNTYISVAQDSVLGPTLHKLIVDAITVGQDAAPRNTNVRIGVVSEIGIGAPPAGQGDINRQSVTDTATIGTQASPVNNNLAIQYPHPIAVVQTIGQYRNPLKISLDHVVTVGQTTLLSGNLIRPFTIVDTIAVAINNNPKRVDELVRHDIVVSAVGAGGGGQRLIPISNTLVVNSTHTNRSDTARQSINHPVTVTHVREARGPMLPITVVHPISVTSGVREIAPRRLDVSHSVITQHDVTPRLSAVRIPVFSTLTTQQHFRSNIVSDSVSHAVTVKSNQSTHEQTVITRINVASTFGRNVLVDLSQAITVENPIDRIAFRDRAIVDTLPVTDAAIRGVVLDRSFEDFLEIPETFYRKRIFLPYLISVPVAAGALVTKYTLMSGKRSAIALPAPQLGDGVDNADLIKIHRSMNGRTVALKVSNTRRRLRLLFRLDKSKALELRSFIQANLSEVITLTLHSGQVWMVQIPDAPVQIQFAGRASQADEFATFEVTMEGQRIT